MPTPILTREEKERIYYLYFGCDIVLIGSDERRKLDVEVLSSPSTYPSFKLLLTPINKLPDEELLELCKLAHETVFGDFRFSHWEVEHDYEGVDNFIKVFNPKSQWYFSIDAIGGRIEIWDKNGDRKLTEDDFMGSSFTNPLIWQWYFRNSIAIPLYPWDMNAIELGLAIDRTKKLEYKI